MLRIVTCYHTMCVCICSQNAIFPHTQVQRLGGSLITKETLAVVPVLSQQRVVWECGCVCGAEEGKEEVWLCGGEGRLGVISYAGGSVTFTVHTAEVWRYGQVE